MFEDTRDLNIVSHDRTKLEKIVEETKGWCKLGTKGFAPHIVSYDRIDGILIPKPWTVDIFNDFFRKPIGRVTAEDRRAILEAVKKLNPEGHIIANAIKEILGIDISKILAQLGLFIILLSTILTIYA